MDLNHDDHDTMRGLFDYVSEDEDETTVDRVTYYYKADTQKGSCTGAGATSAQTSSHDFRQGWLGPTPLSGDLQLTLYRYGVAFGSTTALDIWNGAVCLASALLSGRVPSVQIREKRTLELGSGIGLVSIVCAHLGAKQVHITDYDDTKIISNLVRNKNACGFEDKSHVRVCPLMWGDDPTVLEGGASGFDVILLSDLIYATKEHDTQLQTCALALKSGGDVLVSFAEENQPREVVEAFVSRARRNGFVASHISTDGLCDGSSTGLIHLHMSQSSQRRFLEGQMT